VALAFDIPGGTRLELEHLLLDVNGTLTDRGRLIGGVAERLDGLRGSLTVLLLSADTFGSLEDVARQLRAASLLVADGGAKVEAVRSHGPERCAAIGNGANDAAMLEASALGIAVVGREGASGAALRAADVVCGSILEALDLLIDPRALAATLRP
jgi:soluble P-type ATPase